MFFASLKVKLPNMTDWHKLSQEEFNGLQKSALYKIYSDLYDQKEDYRKIMEFIEKTSEAHKNGKLQSTSTKAKEISKTVRNFSPFPILEKCANLILGSNIIARVKTETFPIDTVVHAYRSSSTEEKIKVPDQYREKICDNPRWDKLHLITIYTTV